MQRLIEWLRRLRPSRSPAETAGFSAGETRAPARFPLPIALTALSTLGTIAFLGFSVATQALADPNIALPRTGIQADELAVLVNEDDPLSVRVAEYYQQARNIPEENIIRLRFPPGRSALPAPEFAALKTEIDRRTPSRVQAYAVAWTQPYRVGCMSLTSALAFGFDDKYCSSACGPTAASRYFNEASTRPFYDFQMRPAMMLAGASFEQVKALIDRGVAADHSMPGGTAYLLETSDAARSVRAGGFKEAQEELRAAFAVEILKADALKERKDVMFYFTGQSSVAALETLDFLPGALADHLTSFGGQLTDSKQMSSLRWLEAGATASYGTVVEPCNHLQKFPMPGVAMFHYLQGATAIEAYWKSVFWPGEGVFIGEPLARPFAPRLTDGLAGPRLLQAFSPRAAGWRVEQAESPMGPYRPLPRGLALHPGKNQVRIDIPAGNGKYLRFVR